MKGWELKNLGDILKLEYGKPLPKERRDDAGTHAAYGANGVFCRTNDYYWGKPSIIVGRKGSAGELNLTEDKFWPLDVTYFVTFDDQKYDLSFLHYCLQGLNLTSLAKGVKPGINRNDVYALKAAFPPLPEQKRIVTILDEAFAGIDAAVANTEKNLANARELFESYLNAVFTQKGDGWVSAPIKQHIRFIDYRGKTPKKTESGLRLITAKNVKMGYLQEAPMEFVSPDCYDSWMTRGIPQQGDVLFTTEAPLANVAQFDVAGKVVFAQRIITMQPDRSKLDPVFLKYLLLSSPVQRRIHEKGTGATVQGIKASLLKLIEIEFPASLLAQQQIVTKLDELLAETQRLEAIYQQKLAALTELKQSILQKAFAGELTTLPEKTLEEAVA